MHARPAVNLTPREVQDEIELKWTRRLAPYADRVLRLRCTCDAIIDELQVAGWTLAAYPAGPHLGSQRRRKWPGVEKSVTAGPPPGYLLRITYTHATVPCGVTHRPFAGADLAAAFIAEARRTESRYVVLWVPGPRSRRPRGARPVLAG